MPPPASLAKVTPAEGLRGRVGRTAAAIGMTVSDLSFALSPAFFAYSGGGLRGGSFAVTGGRVELRGLEAVRGVRLTGHTGAGALRLRITGSAAAHGRVRLSASGRLRGRLGGRRLSVRLASVASSSALPHASSARSVTPSCCPVTRPLGAWVSVRQRPYRAGFPRDL
jgi:hypothetical protein